MTNERIPVTVQSLIDTEGRRQDALREAQWDRTSDALTSLGTRMTEGFAATNGIIISQIDRLDALIQTKSARDDATAIKLEEGVTKLAQTVAATTETTRLANAESVAATTLAFDNRLKPVEDAIRTSAGRGSIANPLLLAVVGAFLALGGALTSAVLFRGG